MNTDVTQELLAEMREMNTQLRTLKSAMRDISFVASTCVWLICGILVLTSAIAWVVAFSPSVRPWLPF